MKIVQFIIKKSDYVIPLALLLGSFFIYSYNLEGQPWHGDEITYLGWGGNYFDLIKKGNIGNSCLESLDNCNSLFHIPAFGLTYSPVRNLLIGFPMYLTNEDTGDFYNWSCYWDCYKHDNGPSIKEMTAGRLLSPLFGSLTVMFSFMMGKLLFNKYLGIAASLLFLTYDLWIWYSRTVMVEVHYIFFVMLSLLLLLYAFKNKKNPKIIYFVSSAIAFGVAIDFKMLAITFFALFLGIILLKRWIDTQDGMFFEKKYATKTGLIVFSFFIISFFGIFLTEPGFYKNPLNEISVMKTDMNNYNRDVWYIGYPTIHNVNFQSTASFFHYLLFPSFIEKQISNPILNLNGNFGWTYPPTYSTIPLTTFFFIGFAYLIYNVRKNKKCISEALLLIWFCSTFILTLTIVKDFSLERYLLPLEISVLFIASYGFWSFIKEISNKKIKIIFSIYFIFVHSMTSFSYWEKIYFSPGTTWVNPLHYGTLQESLDSTLTFVANMLFFGFLLFMLILRVQKRTHRTIDFRSN
ncbi:MAG: glycosyltransferase family 39 protein [Thaumarchaeota archaeon]|nr:glycosyltransferase family 39 protein [Nitrososphaerota archaeon]